MSAVGRVRALGTMTTAGASVSTTVVGRSVLKAMGIVELLQDEGRVVTAAEDGGGSAGDVRLVRVRAGMRRAPRYRTPRFHAPRFKYKFCIYVQILPACP